ncbi:MAG TPA: calcium-translocating P-type ATPase, PMCA-type [Iamia sp.]|nr:calcium-translocating P-type ATPase, PMCA-type [Iamia sp.]
MTTASEPGPSAPTGAPSPDGLGSELDLSTVDLANGLDDAGVAESRRRHGTNAFAPLPEKSWVDFFKEALMDPMVQILVVCAAIAIVVGIIEQDPVEGIAIICAIAVVTAVGVRNQLKAQRDYTALDAQSSAIQIRVIRGGRVVEIEASDLVVGDVLELNTGDVSPADVIFAKGNEVLVDEKHITGEPDATKHIEDTIYAGSRILDGSGRAVVGVVGDKTLLGGIRAKLSADREVTPLEERLEVLAGRIGRIGMGAAAFTAAALIIGGLVRGEYIHDGITTTFDFGFNGDTGELVLFAATAAFTIIVVAVPEGLPLAVTLALSYTTRKMATESILVRELPACETMGAGTIICTDKTGTLTEGSMSLAYLWVGGQEREIEGAERTTELDEIAGQALTGFAINSSVDLARDDDPPHAVRVLGNATEGGILKWLDPEGHDYRTIRDGADIRERREFSSTRKHMATLVHEDRGPILYVKGAPEIVLGMCSGLASTGDIDGETTPLDEEGKGAIVALVREYAARGYRTLGIASRHVTEGSKIDDVDEDLVFQALFVLSDPIRTEVPDAVHNCQKAGVKVMMITGDIPETAGEIGRQAGIVTSLDNVVEGSEYRTWTDDKVREVYAAGKMEALARALPEDKERLVTILQGLGEVVGMTGDGVNDAPALKKADVGFAMGSGSQVAREASDVVIVDDNFVSTVSAIRWGRSVFENLRKFVQFQLTVNVVALLTAFAGALLGFGTPLTAVQLLWVNLIMDSFAALALALEPPTDKLFEQKPHGRTEPLISKQMWLNVLASGLLMFAVMMTVLFAPGAFGLKDGDDPGLRQEATEHVQNVVGDRDHVDFADYDDDGDDTLSSAEQAKAIDEDADRRADIYRDSFLFNTFVWLQVFNAFNARSIRADRTPFANLRNSTSFMAIIAIIAVSQVAIMFIGGSVFSIVQIQADEWAKSLVIGVCIIPIGFAIRALGRALGTHHSTQLNS